MTWGRQSCLPPAFQPASGRAEKRVRSQDWLPHIGATPDMMQLMLLPRETAADDADGLVRAASRGDRRAFGELYVRYARMVHGILLARVPPGDAEDLVQEVFLSAMKQLRGLRTAAAFRGWLGTIARHRAVDHFRRTRETASLDGVEPAAPRSGAPDAFLV